jgi:hypothetical protein
MEREGAEAMHVLTRWIDVADRVAFRALVIGALLLAAFALSAQVPDSTAGVSPPNGSAVVTG